MNSRLEMKRWGAIILAILLPIAGLTPTAMATTITGPFIFSPPSGTGTATTLSPGGSLGNTVVLTKSFDTSVVQQASFLIPDGAEGATQYQFTETITNNTGDIWDDFKIAMSCDTLGEGTDCPFFPLSVNYVQDPSNSAPGAVLTSGTNPVLLHWDSMNVAPGDAFNLAFIVDTCANNCSGSWAIFETPSIAAVPEPETLALFLIGLIAMRVRFKQHLDV